MAKDFKKGEKVTVISSWDRKGTAIYRHAIVYSCGNKQMVLTDEATGEEIGRHFSPCVGSLEYTIKQHNGWQSASPAGGTFKRMTDEEALEACLKVGAADVEYQTAHYERCLAGGHGEGYNNAIRKDLAMLHEPRAMSHAEAIAEVRKSLK